MATERCGYTTLSREGERPPDFQRRRQRSILARRDSTGDRSMIFHRHAERLWRKIVAVSVLAAVNAACVQIVFVDKENTPAHARRKTGDDLYRARRLRFAWGPSNSGACGALRECFWRANKSSQRTRGHDGGRTQVYVRIAITHAAFEITIGGADRDLAL